VAVAARKTLPPAVRERRANGGVGMPDPVERILNVGFALALVAVVLQTAAHLTNAFLLDYEVWSIDASGDGNALSWASAVATFGAGLAAFLIGLMPQRPDWRLVTLGCVLAFLSLDDVAMVHEKVAFSAADAVGAPDVVARATWPLLYLPLFAFAVVTLWRLAVGAQDRVRQAIQWGLALLALALVLETLATLWWEDDSRPLIDDLEIALEEGAELGGWILIATGLLAIAYETLLRARPRPEATPRPTVDAFRR
jgi:hypothetical protein